MTSSYLCACPGTSRDKVEAENCGYGCQLIDGKCVEPNLGIGFIDDPTGCQTCRKLRIVTGGMAIMRPKVQTLMQVVPTTVAKFFLCNDWVSFAPPTSSKSSIGLGLPYITFDQYTPPVDTSRCMRWIEQAPAARFCCDSKKTADVRDNRKAVLDVVMDTVWVICRDPTHIVLSYVDMAEIDALFLR